MYICGRIISFGNLEHFHLLPISLKEISRVLTADGFFDIAIPAEGGLVNSVYKKFFTKRHLKKYGIKYPDKICKFEHCNTCWYILQEIKSVFTITERSFLPFRLPVSHLNAIIVLRAVKKS